MAEKRKTEETIEGKLYGTVKKGDMIVMSGIVEVAGFVRDFSFKGVELSYEDPFKAAALNSSSKNYYFRASGWGRGDRTYFLDKFSSYKVWPQEDWKAILEEINKKEKKKIQSPFNGQIMKGDLIQLYSDKLEVAGYVLDLDNTKVELSHENPFLREKYVVSQEFMIYRLGSVKNRQYYINKFPVFQMIQRVNQAEIGKSMQEIQENQESVATATAR